MASYPKRCSKCDSDNGPAAKRCRICKETITSVNETNEDDDTQQILNMGKTNPTKQFNMLKKRAKILNLRHDWDIVVMATHKHVRGSSFVTFGTAGLAANFIGTTNNPSPTGKAVLDVFRLFTNEKKTFKSDQQSSRALASSSTDLPSTTTGTVITTSTSTVPSPISTDHPGVSIVPSSTSTVAPPTSTILPSISTVPASIPTDLPLFPLPPSLSTVRHSASIVSPLIPPAPLAVSTSPPTFAIALPTSTVSLPISSGPRSTSAVPSSISTILTPVSCPQISTHEIATTVAPPTSIDPQVTTTVSSPTTTVAPPSALVPTSLTSSADMPPDAVALYDDGKIVAVGNIVDRPTLHGHLVPEGCSCILVLWAEDNYPAPHPLGRKDLRENTFLHKDMFYAIPRQVLKRFLRHQNRYFLSPLQ